MGAGGSCYRQNRMIITGNDFLEAIEIETIESFLNSDRNTVRAYFRYTSSYPHDVFQRCEIGIELNAGIH